MKQLTCLALALTIGVVASPSRAAEGAVQEYAVRSGATPSSDLTATFAKCRFVDPPMLVDGAAANPDEMGWMADAVEFYLQRMKVSLGCLTRTEQGMEDTLSEGQRASINSIYNNGVDQMNFVAKEFNRQLRVFQMSERAGQSSPDDLSSFLQLFE